MYSLSLNFPLQLFCVERNRLPNQLGLIGLWLWVGALSKLRIMKIKVYHELVWKLLLMLHTTKGIYFRRKKLRIYLTNGY
jgi:hypothetical protein